LDDVSVGGVPRPEIASASSTSFGVTWTDRRQVFFSLVTTSGDEPTSITGEVSSNTWERSSPVVTWADTDYVVVWAEHVIPDEGSGEEPYWAIVRANVDRTTFDTSGTEPVGVVISEILRSSVQLSELALATIRGGIVIAWKRHEPDGSFIELAYLPEEGETTFPSSIESDQASNPRLAVIDPDNVSLVYRDVPEDELAGEIFVIAVSSSVENGIQTGEPIRITNAPGVSDVPTAAWSSPMDGELGVVWHDERSEHRQVLIGRLDLDWTVFVDGFELQGTEEQPADLPALVAMGPISYVLAWRSRGGDTETVMAAQIGCQ